MTRQPLYAIIALIIAVLLAYILLSLAREDGPGPIVYGQLMPQLYKGIPLDAHLLKLDKEALDLAYLAHTQLLWSVFMKDAAAIKDASRITNGLRISRQAYQIAVTQIEEREREIEKRDSR
jgi:hypothetical protein